MRRAARQAARAPRDRKPDTMGFKKRTAQLLNRRLARRFSILGGISYSGGPVLPGLYTPPTPTLTPISGS